ncbi:MAG: hypothetical protein AAF628_33000 [Planctomycetota bacterium]
MTQTPPSTRSLILVPAIITLAVTALRFGLELGGAPAWLANAEAGGPGALIGIAWLPLVFGPYFAFRLRPFTSSTGALAKRLAGTLVAYGLAARIPVVLLTIAALFAEWGTHYEKFPFEGGLGAKIGVTLGAQLVFWACVWTPLTGTIAGLIANALRPRNDTVAVAP